MLPKGRKNAGDTLEAAAVRETMEESGFNCTLFKHNLPTKAQNLQSLEHTEPIAVQQRMHGGIRKIIFWYAAQVDSCDEQTMGTQEQGEDFDVRWVSTEHAASHMSFLEDRKVVEKALEAVQSIPFGLVSVSFDFRGAYLNTSIDPRGLGFLCISLGGSRVSQGLNDSNLQQVKVATDWDGFGIVDSQEDIIALIDDSRPELCALLRIEKEEHPQIKVSSHALPLY